ncbi:MAG: hypothetical protein AAFY84_09770 [Pseudomonadota bacterium]
MECQASTVMIVMVLVLYRAMRANTSIFTITAVLTKTVIKGGNVVMVVIFGVGGPMIAAAVAQRRAPKLPVI